MAIQPELQPETPEAKIEIPTDWLMRWLDLDAVRQAQRPDALATMTGYFLTLSGRLRSLSVLAIWLRLLPMESANCCWV